MALADRRKEIYEFVKANRKYTEHNEVVLDIYEGNLIEYVEKVLARAFSEEYFNKIKSRILPVNILQRYVDKVAKVYNLNPQRSTKEKKDQEVMKFYEEELDMNVSMNIADEYVAMFKGYALEPYLKEDKDGKNVPRLRVLPYDRFLVMSSNIVDPLEPTVFIKFMGKKRKQTKNGMKEVELFWVYTDDEFDAFDSELESLDEFLKDNQGVNPFGVIPFLYGNRSNNRLLPTQDTDILAITKMIPTMLTDMGGAIMFQCFSIIYGIDVAQADLKLSPNAFWNLKSDKASDKRPEIGTIKPEADVDKVLRFIITTFTMWLETKGIKVGAIGNVDASNVASGISKIIDEMDTSALKKKNSQAFKSDEKDFWQVLKVMHNYWVETLQLRDQRPFTDNFEMAIEFDPPRPVMDRKTEVETVKLEQDSGYLDHKSAMKRLYPDLGDEELDERIELINKEQGENNVIETSGSDQQGSSTSSGSSSGDEPTSQEEGETGISQETQGDLES